MGYGRCPINHRPGVAADPTSVGGGPERSSVPRIFMDDCGLAMSLCMGQYNEFVQIFKKDLEREQEQLRLYQRGELRTMSLEADRWCDSTVNAIEEIKQRITELKARLAKYEKDQAPRLLPATGLLSRQTQSSRRRARALAG